MSRRDFLALGGAGAAVAGLSLSEATLRLATLAAEYRAPNEPSRR